MGRIELALGYLDSAKVEDLDDLELFEKLRRRLNKSRSEQYAYFSTMQGADCAYTARSFDKFCEYDIEELKALVLTLAERLNG